MLFSWDSYLKSIPSGLTAGTDLTVLASKSISLSIVVSRLLQDTLKLFLNMKRYVFGK